MQTETEAAEAKAPEAPAEAVVKIKLDHLATQEQELQDAIAMVEAGDEPAAEPEAEAAPEVAAESPGDKGTELTPGEEAEAEPVVEEKDSTAWSAIKAAERRAQDERESLKAEREEIKVLRDQLRKDQEDRELARQKMREDPLKMLEQETGVTYEDLTNRVLNDGKASSEEQLRRQLLETQNQIKELREMQAQTSQQFQAQTEQRALGDYKREVVSALKSEDFELLAEYEDAADQVMEFAEGYVKQHGKVLTAAEATGKMQDVLRQQLSKLVSSKAARKALGLGDPVAPAPEPSGSISRPSESAAPKTITNEMASAPRVPFDWDNASEEEQIAEALKHCEG